jgi:hypothetical protein
MAQWGHGYRGNSPIGKLSFHRDRSKCSSLQIIQHIWPNYDLFALPREAKRKLGVIHDEAVPQSKALPSTPKFRCITVPCIAQKMMRSTPTHSVHNLSVRVVTS